MLIGKIGPQLVVLFSKVSRSIRRRDLTGRTKSLRGKTLAGGSGEGLGALVDLFGIFLAL